ncbi:AEC family transporter [Pararhodobacter oceanensis]|uniref:Transporter n=1 Tax=Pararhodobacter oceanensis TaxID=2172121 RepID=A0A2T8HPB4_9RHOB|nr:AEC family transporter [Pararhodobacter oceanensis]PVH27260.1 hypothetical protein DDE20_18565 [Pararhodobacter oceanensis]
MLIGLSPKSPNTSTRNRLLIDTIRNPIILSIVLGLVVNAVTDGPIRGLHDFTDIVGSAALPLMLLCVVAGLSFSGAQGKILPLVLSSIGKQLIFPLLVIGVAVTVGLSGPDAIVLVVFGAASTASASLNLARQLNGDVALMSTIFAAQTTVLFVTLPATLIIAQILLTNP